MEKYMNRRFMWDGFSQIFPKLYTITEMVAIQDHSYVPTLICRSIS